MSQDKKKKQQQKKRSRALLAVACVTGAFLVLCGAYWGKFGVIPFAEGEFSHFIKVWEWII